MDEPVSTPSQASPQPDPSHPDAIKREPLPTRPRDRAAALAGELREKMKAAKAAEESDDEDEDDEPAPKPKAKAKAAEPKAEEPKVKAPEPTAKNEKLLAKIDDAGGKGLKQKADESNAEFEMRLTKELRRAEAAEKRADAEKGRADGAEAKAAKYEKLLEEGKKNPLKVLKHLGIKFDELARGIYEDKFKEPGDEPQLPPEWVERMEALEREAQEARSEKTKAQEERKKAEAVETRKRHIVDVQKILDANAEDFPLISSFRWAAGNIVDTALANGVTDIGPIIEELEKSLETNWGDLVKNERARKKLAKADYKEMYEDLVKRLGGLPVAAAKTADEDDDSPRLRSVGDLEKEPATKRKRTRAEKIAAAAAELQARLAKRNSDDEDDEDEDD